MSTAQKPKDVWRQLSARTIFLHQAIADHLRLNITDHKCLDLLMQGGPMTAGKLAEASGLTTGAITGVVDRLEKSGFVMRTSDKADRRKTVIVLLSANLADIIGIFQDIREKTEALMSGYSGKERAAINDFAQKTGDMVEEFVGQLKASERGEG